MAALTFPTAIYAQAAEFYLEGRSQVFRSPLSGSEQVAQLAGARWVASLTFSRWKSTEDEINELEAFLHRMQGASTLFNLWNHRRTNPRGTVSGTGLINGAGQSGTTLITDNWALSQPVLFKAGDMFAVNNELKQAVVDVASDGGGNASLTFVPPLRASPANNAVITVTQATGEFRLASDSAARARHTGPNTDIVISAVESFAGN